MERKENLVREEEFKDILFSSQLLSLLVYTSDFQCAAAVMCQVSGWIMETAGPFRIANERGLLTF